MAAQVETMMVADHAFDTAPSSPLSPVGGGIGVGTGDGHDPSHAQRRLDISGVTSSVMDDQPKLKKSQRLLRSIQRISSSPALAQLGGRARSASASSRPYGGAGSLSCVSLASSPSPFGQSSMGSSYFSTADHPSAPTSTSGSPMATAELPDWTGIETIMAVRKVEAAAAPAALSMTAALPAEVRLKKKTFRLWDNLPHEIRIHVLSFLQPKELVRASRVCKEFYKTCFDGQLWTCFDASEFYKDIPADSLASIIVAAGPFVKDLNLRGCVQVEHYKRAEVMVKACRNLINATLEGCRNFQRTTLHNLLKNNEKLAHLNLTGLTAVTNTTCKIIAQSCPQLEMFNVSWCKHMDARGIKSVVEACPKLKDLRAGEIRGFDNTEVANVLFQTNNLERLVLSGCEELTDNTLRTMLYGFDPEIDILTDRPLVPPRRLRHLDLSRCNRLTTEGVKALGHFVPELEGLQLAGVTTLTDQALEPILASTPRLTHLELEDLRHLTNSLMSEHLAKAPCAAILTHLSMSYCEAISDAGMIPVIRACASLRSVDADNTRVSDLFLAEAASLVRRRSLAPTKTAPAKTNPGAAAGVKIGLSLVVYDCQHVTWLGVREVLNRNAEVGRKAVSSGSGAAEVIALKCFYGWQMTVDEHTKRVLRRDFDAAGRLERKWADFMQATEEAGTTGAGNRRRRRRAREAQLVHADEEEGGGGGNGGFGGAGAGVVGRRRARTAACAVM